MAHKRAHLTPEEAQTMAREKPVKLARHLDGQAAELQGNPSRVIQAVGGALADTAKELRGEKPNIPRPL